jgi:hypothetical protein
LVPTCPTTTRDKEDAEHWLHALLSTSWALLLLLYEITYWTPFTLKGFSVKQLKTTVVRACDISKSRQRWGQGGDKMGWVDSDFLFSTHCISKHEYLQVFVPDFSLPAPTGTPEGRWRSPGTSCWYRSLTPDYLPFLHQPQVSGGP